MPKFHVDLSHLADPSGLKFAVGARTFELQRHTPQTVKRARDIHASFQVNPGMAKRFTHFADVRATEFPEQRIRWIRIIRPNPDPAIFVPEIVLMSVYCPDIYLRTYYSRKL